MVEATAKARLLGIEGIGLYEGNRTGLEWEEFAIV